MTSGTALGILAAMIMVIIGGVFVGFRARVSKAQMAINNATLPRRLRPGSMSKHDSSTPNES